MMRAYNREEIRRRYRDFCDEAEDALSRSHPGCPDNLQYDIVVSGSSPFLYCGMTTRSCGTDDIDIARANVSLEIAGLFSKYDMNTGPSAFPGHLPYNYEDRLQTLHQTTHMSIFAPSWEDLAFSKLQRYSDTDKEDVLGIEALDLHMLAYLVLDPEESRGSGLSDSSYSQLLSNFCDFIVEFHSDMMKELNLEQTCRQMGSVGERHAVFDEFGNYMLDGEELAMFMDRDEARGFAERASTNGISAHVDEMRTYLIRRVGNIRTFTLFE